MAVPGKKATNQFSSSITYAGQTEDIDVYCQPCDLNNGPRLPAHGYCTNCSEHLCENCFSGHKRHKMFRNHTLLDKVNMPQSMSFSTKSYPDNLSKPCPKHNIEMIKFYCHDHEDLLCNVCVTLEHTPCKVNYIPDVSDQVINSDEYRDVLESITAMTKKASKELQNMKKMNGTSNKSLDEALTDMKKFRTKMNQRIDELEKKVEDAVKAIQDENIKNMASVEKKCEDLSKSLKARSDSITHFNTSSQANDLFVELKQAQQEIKDHEQSFATLTECEVKEYIFEPNEVISNPLSKEVSLGTLKGRPISLKLKSRKISHMDRICAKTSKDISYSGISGMTLLTPDHLIITEYYNKAVKMVEISKRSILDQQQLDSYPWDLTSVSQNDIAVTIPDNQTIQVLSVCSNNLKKSYTLKVDGECRGISCHKDKMVVSFTNPAKVQILLINGTVLQTIQDENIFKHPRYITTSDNCIYVADRDMHTLIKLGWSGEVKEKYDCGGRICDLAMTEDRTVFVCFEDKTIREISEDFTNEQTVVEDLQNPQAVCWSAEACTLYTNSWTSCGEENELVKIFKFS